MFRFCLLFSQRRCGLYESNLISFPHISSLPAPEEAGYDELDEDERARPPRSPHSVHSHHPASVQNVQLRRVRSLTREPF